MRKVFLVLASLLVVSMFLVGCSGDKKSIKIVDKNGSLVGKAFWMEDRLQIEPQVVERLELSPCIEVGDCGFVKKEDLKLECKTFGNIGTTNNACQQKGYDTCAGATLFARISYQGSSSLFTFPVGCEKAYDSSLSKDLIKNNLPTGGYEISDIDSGTVCCKIK